MKKTILIILSLLTTATVFADSAKIKFSGEQAHTFWKLLDDKFNDTTTYPIAPHLNIVKAENSYSLMRSNNITRIQCDSENNYSCIINTNTLVLRTSSNSTSDIEIGNVLAGDLFSLAYKTDLLEDEGSLEFQIDDIFFRCNEGLLPNYNTCDTGQYVKISNVVNYTIE